MTANPLAVTIVALTVNAHLLSVDPDKIQNLLRVPGAHQPFLTKKERAPGHNPRTVKNQPT